jgi:hypothetical protein
MYPTESLSKSKLPPSSTLKMKTIYSSKMSIEGTSYMTKNLVAKEVHFNIYLLMSRIPPTNVG